MMPGTLSIISNAFPPEERGKAIGTWAGVSALTLAIGPVVGGALTEYVSWRAIFFLNLPVAAGAVAVTLFAARESRDETVTRTVDRKGILALSVGLSGLVLALVEGNQWGWGSPGIVVVLGAAVIGLMSFAALEARVKAPMVDFSFFRSRTFLGTNVVAFVVSFAMLATFFFTALYMQNILGYGALEAGLRFLPATAFIVVTAPIAGRLADRIGAPPLMAGGLVMVSIALYLQTRITVDTGYGTLLPAFAILGLGMGFVMAPMSTAAMNSVRPEKAGAAAGMLAMSRMVGGTFGVAALGALFSYLSANRLAESLAGTGVTAAQRERLVEELGSGSGEQALQGLDPATSQQVGRAVKDAFVHALSNGMWFATGLTLFGALTAALLIRERPEPAPSRRQATGEAEALGV